MLTQGYFFKKVLETHIKSIIYGGLDGILTTFAIVASASGASLPTTILLILGFANLFADGISMACGDFLSSRAENEYHQKEHTLAEQAFHHNPDREQTKIKEIFLKDGFTSQEAEQLTHLISTKKHRVVTLILSEQGIKRSNGPSSTKALVTFGSFCLFGFVPLSTYIINFFIPITMIGSTFILASFLTAMTLFILGAIKVIITGRNWLYSGLEMMAIGGFSAVAAYVVGHILSRLIA